ncbi:MAG: polymer-forming cytoskeletal protein, partial [Parcubacteria group bacterium]|nr:polymer-forming cytoskeletal protein [Parcubacteria group bacterium]
MLKKSLRACVLALALSPLAALAASSVHIGSDYFLKGNEKAAEDVYIIAPSAVFSGTVSGDAVAVARTVRSDGTLGADALFAGEFVTVERTVADDVRILGGTVQIRGKIEGDAVLVGANVIVEEGAVVSGSVYAIGGDIIIAGIVGGEVQAAAGSIHISGSVGGAVELWGEEVELSSGASIGSDFIYHAPREASIAPDVRIGGETLFDKQDGTARGIVSHFSSGFVSFQLLAALTMSFFLFLLFRERGEEILLDASLHFWQRTLRGFLIFLTVPFAGAFLFFTVIGIPLGIAFAALYLTALISAFAYGGMLLGVLLERPLFKRSPFPLSARTVFVGVALLAFLQAIPYLGFAALFLFTLASLGSLGTIGWRRVKHMP